MLCLAALLAGFVDAVVGGGGLIQLPAMLLLLPGVPYPTVVGTGKVSSLAGTAAALRRYLMGGQAGAVAWRVVGTAALAAGAGALLGARVATLLPRQMVRPMVLALLIIMAIYTLWRKEFGLQHRPRLAGARAYMVAVGLGFSLGFYDGVFGPGTGSLLLFAFVGLFGYDFLAASASAKLVNVATNLASLIYFITTRQVLFAVALPMAACNMLGSALGARLAQRRGTGFVRGLFLVVVSAFILKLGWDILSAVV